MSKLSKLLLLIPFIFLYGCGDDDPSPLTGGDPSTLTGGVSINGSPLDGNTLTISDNANDSKGMNDSTYSWYQNDSLASSASTFIVPYLANNTTLYIKKNYKDDDGVEKFFKSANITIVGAAVPSNDSFSIMEDGTFLLNILSNDVNIQEQSVSLASSTNDDVVTSLSNGKLSIQTKNNFHGSFSSTYTLKRNGRISVPATITATIAPVNDPHTGSMTINGSPEIGSTLAFLDTVSDVDGQNSVSYGWKLDGLEVSSSNSLVLTQLMLGKKVIVFKKYNDTFADRIIESDSVTVIEALNPNPLDDMSNPIGNIPADSETGAFLPNMTEYELSNSYSGMTILWDGSNADINFLREGSGKTFINIPRPNANSSDKVINLIAKTTVSGVTYSKTFPITVPKKATRTTKQLVIRVKFSDSDFHTSSSESYEENRMFNDTTMGDINNYSVNGFFYENSSHRSKLIRAVMPTVNNSGMTNGSIVDTDLNDGVLEYHATFPRPFDRYPSSTITKNILNDIDSYVDFSTFDTNNNNIIETTELDILFNYAICNRASVYSVCYPGPSGTDYSVQGFWPAATTSSLYSINTDDGVRVGGSGTSRMTWVTDYIMFTNAPSVKILQDDFNIVAHELGHNLYESPDLYGGDSSLSIAYWGLMGQSYAQYNGKRVPQHMTAHQKITRGLTDPSISTPYSRSRTGSFENLVLTNQITDNSNRLVVVSNESTMTNIYDKQYFSLGMRSQDSGFDRGLQVMPSFTPGVLISHVSPYNHGNSYAADYWSLNNNIVTNDQLENTSHLYPSTSLFRDGQVVDGATKFHINTYLLPLFEKEHVVSTNIQMDVSKIGDDKFNIQLRSTQ